MGAIVTVERMRPNPTSERDAPRAPQG
jgi:hypothetical protein